MLKRYCILLLFLTPLLAHAQPYAYWTNASSNTIGRANLDGSSANQGFITGANFPFAVTVDGAYVYWTNFSGNTIGRANLDGSNANQSFITGANVPLGLTVDGTYVYWTNHNGNTIGRANLDGSNPNQSFIFTGSEPAGIAVDGTAIYWTHWNGKTVGRANLDGTNVNNAFIPTTTTSGGVAVDGTFIYWTNSNAAGTTIGRANLDGSNVNQNFITGASDPRAISVDGGYIYWANTYTNSVGRASLDGTGVNTGFITGGNFLTGLTTTNSGTLPVELVNFTATLDGSSARLRWETASETNNAGFDVEHRQSGSFQSVGFTPGHGTTAETSHYAFTTTDLAPGTHTFRLRQIDFDGAMEYSPEVELTIEADGLALAIFGNPTSGAIRGSVVLPNAQTARVRLFDVLGREVRAQDEVAGTFALDVTDCASGGYVLRIEAGAQAITRSIVVAQ